MRTLLIGLSLAAMLVTPALAAECDRISAAETSTREWSESFANDFGIDIAVPSLPSEPVLQHAVIRFYILPEQFMLRPTHFAEIQPEHSEFDPRIMPASQFRIKAFRSEMRERFGETGNLHWT